MLPRIEYLDFASRWYGRVRFDLATSGIAAIAPEALGAAPRWDDPTARERFRAAVAARYAVPVTEVVPVLGASGGLFVASATFLRRGDRLLVETPCYEPLWRTADVLGCGVDRFERGAIPNLGTVLAALRPETRMVALTNPHNPSGTLLDDSFLVELARALTPRNVVLLVDEAYLELSRPGTTARRLGANVVTTSSATKCWGAGFARAGWVLCPAARADDAAHVERYVNGLSPLACWELGARAVGHADTLLERAHEHQRGKRELVDRFIEAAGGRLTWVPPAPESPFGFVRDSRGEDVLPLIERGAKELGVLAAPGKFFGEPSAFRLSWTADRPTVAEGLGHLATALELEGTRS